jgi:hypothetical protein
MRERLPLLLVFALLPALLLWPLPQVATQQLLTAPEYEGASHLWGLWAAWQEASPVRIRSTLLAWPSGVDLVLVDPIHLPAFGLGLALSGPVLGFNLVVLQGLLVAGLAGALLARESGGAPWLGALASMAVPGLVGASGDGITEDLAVGFVALFAALLLRARRLGGPGPALLAALGLGLCGWAGPYNALLAALVLVGISLVPRPSLASLRRSAGVGLGGLILAAPPLWAVLRARSSELPGAAARAGIPAPDVGPDRFRGGLMHGVDLLDPWLPAALTGGLPPIGHSAYLGLVALGAGLFASWRQPRLRLPLAGIGLLLLLGLGPWLSLAGRPVELGGEALMAPAGWLMLAIPPLARLSRWYRAALLAGLLLAPLAAAAAGQDRRARALLAAALLADTLLLAPLAWPLPATPLPGAALVEALEDLPPGALLELPLSTTGSPPPGDWRDVGPLLQTRHGRPLGGAMMGLPPSEQARRAQRAVLELARGGGMSPRERQALTEAGFRAVLVRTRFVQLPPEGPERLSLCLGPLLHEEEGLRLHAIEEGSRPCEPRDADGVQGRGR